MVMDALRSHHLTRTRITVGGRVIWVRWYPAAPGALPFPHWHAFGSPVWEPDRSDDFEGPGCFHRPLIWRPKAFPAPPGQEFHGLPEWYLDGLPDELLNGEINGEVCGQPTADPRGGLVIDGVADQEQQEVIVSLIVQKTTVSELTTSQVLDLGDDGTAYRLSASGPVDIFGLLGGVQGRLIILENVGAHLINLMHQNGSASASARIITIDQIACRLYPGMAGWLQYDGDSLRWRELNTVPFVRQKGDLLTHTLTTVARLPVSPTEGHVLKAAPSEPTGMEWGPVDAGRDWWYYPPGWTGTSPFSRWQVAGYATRHLNFAAPVAAGVVYALPLPRPRGGTIDRIGIRVGTPGAPGSMARLGIYASTDPPNLEPAALMLDAGEVAIGSGDGPQELEVEPPLAIPAGALIWLAVLFESGCSVSGIPATVADPAVYPIMGFQDLDDDTPGYGWRAGSAAMGDQWDYGDGLPDPWPSITTDPPSVQVLEWGTGLSMPAIFVRYSA